MIGETVPMTARELELLRGGRKNLAFFFRAEFASGVVRLFAGAGDYPVEADAVETEGGVYVSAGLWGGDLPEVDHLINGQAQGLTLSLSGVDVATVRTFVGERAEVVGAPAAFGWGVLDEQYRPAGPIRWPLRGRLFQPRVRRARSGEAAETRVLAATLMVGAYARRRGLHAYFTKADQRRAHPTDAGCDRVGLYSVETTRPWPR
jgi:hypothetical protein